MSLHFTKASLHIFNLKISQKILIISAPFPDLGTYFNNTEVMFSCCLWVLQLFFAKLDILNLIKRY